MCKYIYIYIHLKLDLHFQEVKPTTYYLWPYSQLSGPAPK